MITNLKFVLLLIVLSTILTQSDHVKIRRSPRIAIIGGGIGGTVTAHELSKLAALKNLEIHLDLYEPREIGGRLATTKVNGNEFETGGSVIHIRNQLMMNYIQSNGLQWSYDANTEDDKLGLYDGNEFVYVSTVINIWNVVRLWWRYGLDLISLQYGVTSPMLDHFERIYQAQEDEVVFDDVHSMLEYMHVEFPSLMKVELEDVLRSRGYSERFIGEFIFLGTHINYNQGTDLPAFVGVVAVAGCDDYSLVSVEGGNKQVPEILLNKSDASLIKQRVDSVYLLPNFKYAISAGESSHIYDIVVIACPLIANSENGINFENFTDLNIPVINYQQTVTTLVHGILNHTFFNYPSPDGLPNQIFSVNKKLFYNCVSVVNPVVYDPNYDRNVFKVFSKEILTDEQLNLLFRIRDHVAVIPWLAYPAYDTEDKDLPFILHDNLFYVNSVEWAASAMEMSAISGYNVALQVIKKVENKDF